jgi:urease accessory protein
MDMAINTIIDHGRNTTALIRLMTWLSPAFPIGAFAYSGGLEKAIEDGRVSDAEMLAQWLDGLMTHGALKTDAVLFSLSYKSASDPELGELAELALALAGSAERYKETVSLGAAFLDAACVWHHPRVEAVRMASGNQIAYPVAAGSVAGTHETGLEEGIAAFLHSCLSQLVSVAIRCGVIGQKQGVGLIASFEAKVSLMAETVAGCSEDDLGSAAFMAEISSLRHETQVTRLFRS